MDTVRAAAEAAPQSAQDTERALVALLSAGPPPVRPFQPPQVPERESERARECR